MAGPETPPPRAKRKARVRAQLIAETRTLIAERGVDGLRISELMDRVDYSFGTFYSYFRTKDDIIEAVVSETITHTAENLAGMVSTLTDPAEQACAGLRSLVRIAVDDPQLALLLLNLNRAEARFEAMVWEPASRVVDRGLAENRFTLSDRDTFLMMVVGSTLALMTGILEGRLSGDVDTRFGEMMLQLLGLDSAEAREIANRPLPRLSAEV